MNEFEINERLEALQEMYFGKLLGLAKIEDLFTILKKKYERSINSMSSYRDMTRDPILKKIGSEISDLFGFKDVAITITSDKRFNAYTVPFIVDERGNSYDINNRKFDYKKLSGSVIVNNNGFFFNKKKFPTNLLVCLNMGCLFNSPITIPELVAVLLHEIGHNFSMVVMGYNATARADEKFADQFAAMYGYGADLSSAFSKVMIDRSKFDLFFKDIPVLNVIYGFNQIRKASEEISEDNPHPVTRNRMESMIRQMETDLKDTPNLTPGMRADLEREIARCKEIVRQTFDPTDKDNMGERMVKNYYGITQQQNEMEMEGEKEADKYSHPTKLNKKIETMYHKKGWFR